MNATIETETPIGGSLHPVVSVPVCPGCKQPMVLRLRFVNQCEKCGAADLIGYGLYCEGGFHHHLYASRWMTPAEVTAKDSVLKWWNSRHANDKAET